VKACFLIALGLSIALGTASHFYFSYRYPSASTTSRFLDHPSIRKDFKIDDARSAGESETVLAAAFTKYYERKYRQAMTIVLASAGVVLALILFVGGGLSILTRVRAQQVAAADVTKNA
jgi:hypothetical protein